MDSEKKTKQERKGKEKLKTLRLLLPSDKKSKSKYPSTLKAVSILIDHLEKTSIDLEGLCRVGGNVNKVKELKEKLLIEGEKVDLEDILDKHIVSGALKLIFREMEEPLLTFDLYANFLAAAELKEQKPRASFLRSLIVSLPQENGVLLKALLKFLHNVQSHSEVNKMTCANLAIVFAPTLLRPRSETVSTMMNDASITTEVMKSLIENYNSFYPDESTIVNINNSEKTEIKIPLQTPENLVKDLQTKLDAALQACADESQGRAVWESYSQSLEGKLASKDEELKLLKEEKDDIESENEELKKKIEESVSEITTLNNKLKESDENYEHQISSMKKTIEVESDSKMKEEEQNLKKLQDEISTLKKSLMESETTARKMKDDSVFQKAEIAQIKADGFSKLKQSQEEIATLKKTLSQFEGNCARLEREAKNFESLLDKAKVDQVEFEEKYNELHNEVLGLQKSILGYQEAKERIQIELEETNSEIANLTQKNTDSEKLIAQLKEELKSKISELESTSKKSIEQLTQSNSNSIKQLNDEIATLKKTISQFEEENKNLKSSFHQTSNQKTDSDKKYSDLQNEIATLKKTVSQSEEETKKLKVLLNQTTTQKTHFENKCGDLQKEVSTIQKSLSELNESSKKKATEINDAKVEIQILTQKNFDGVVLISRLKEEILELKSKVNESESTHKKSSEQVHSHEHKITQSNHTIKQLTEEVSTLKTNLISSESTIEKLKTELSNFKNQVEVDKEETGGLKQVLFTWISLALKFDAMTKGKLCFLNSADLWDELQSKSLPINQWPTFISTAMDDSLKTSGSR